MNAFDHGLDVLPIKLVIRLVTVRASYSIWKPIAKCFANRSKRDIRRAYLRRLDERLSSPRTYSPTVECRLPPRGESVRPRSHSLALGDACSQCDDTRPTDGRDLEASVAAGRLVVKRFSSFHEVWTRDGGLDRLPRGVEWY